MCVNGSRRPGAIAYGFAIANNKSFASSARNAFSLDARASRIVFVFRDRRGIVDSLTRRWSAERTLRDSAKCFFALCWYRNRIGFGTNERVRARGDSFFYLGAGFWGFGPAPSVHVGHSICTGRRRCPPLSACPWPASRCRALAAVSPPRAWVAPRRARAPSPEAARSSPRRRPPR